MKRVLGAILATTLVLVLSVEQVSARSAARLRWEGAAITLGALSFLSVLSQAAQAQSVEVRPGSPYDDYPTRWDGPPPQPPPRAFEPGPYEQPPPPYGGVGGVRVPGYWEETEVWVPLTWGLVWIWDDDRYRDRYDRYGRSDRRDRYRDRYERRSGRYERRPSGGHFERRRVWREGYYR